MLLLIVRNELEKIMKPLRLEPDVAKHFISVGTGLTAIGAVVSMPMEYSLGPVIDALYPLFETWPRLMTIIIWFTMVAYVLRRRSPAVAEWFGAFAVIAVLSPMFSLIAGLPKDVGWPLVVIALGGMLLVFSLSAWTSATVMRQLTK